jgi:signal transduction histidine kinase
MTDNFRESASRRSVTLELSSVDTPQESLDRLRLEVAELRASRERLVLAADADRREIERTLHDGVHQRLIALAVNLQFAGRLAETDPAAEKALLEEMKRDVQQALDEAAQLAQRIYPPLLEMGGLAAALRSAAASAGIPVSVEVTAGASYPPEVAGTVYLCCLAALEHADIGARATVTVREEGGKLAFEVVADATYSHTGLDRLHDRVETLGGALTIRSEPGGGTRVAGSLPLSR